MIVRLPASMVLAWSSSRQESMSGEQSLVDGEKLLITVEKDFADEPAG